MNKVAGKMFLLISFLAASCTGKNGFTGIKQGMKPTDVIALVGAPVRKQSMGMAEWWIYNDKDKHIVVINNDTVTNCTTQQEAMKIMNDVLKSIDSAKKN